MISSSAWRVTYGAILTVLIAAGIVASVMDLSTFSQKTLRELRTAFSYVLLVQLGIFALFSMLERVLSAAGPRKPGRGYLLNLSLQLFERVTSAALRGVVGACVVALGQRFDLGWFDLRFSTGHGLGASLLAFLLSTFIYDFFFYWFHRLQHESVFLWQEHKLHHMDEQLCALFRESPLEALLQGTATLVPISILFKLDAVQGAILGNLLFAWVVLIHTNIRLPLGRASVLFTGPQVHRIHHSRVREHFDRNYAAFFPLWDILFGTYHHPQRNEYPLTGVYGETEVRGFLEAVTLPFREWRKMWTAT